jgi:hypothetical protein
MKSIEKFKRLKSWQQHIVRQIEQSPEYLNLKGDFLTSKGLTAMDIIGKIDKIKACGGIIEIGRKYENVNGIDEEKLEVINTNYCRQHLICPVCADRVQGTRRGRLLGAIKGAVEKYNYSYHVVFTIKNEIHLGRAIRKMKCAFRRFQRFGQRRNDNFSYGEYSKVRAGCVSFEAVRGQGSGAWHYHGHSLLFTDRPLDYRVYDPEKYGRIVRDACGKASKDQLMAAALNTVDVGGSPVPVSKLSGEWFAATNGESININVIPLFDGSESAPVKNPYKVIENAVEVIKYMSKLNNNKIGDIVHILKTAYNERFFEVFRDFRGLGDDDFKADEKTDTITMSWDRNSHDYINPQFHSQGYFKNKYVDLRADFRTQLLQESARLLARFRRARKEIMQGIYNGVLNVLSVRDKIELIDIEHEKFKRCVRELWKKILDLDRSRRFLPPPLPVQMALEL